jgi:hypothetical protein
MDLKMEKRPSGRKKNWMRGFDRIAILLALPIAIFGSYYISKAVAESQGVLVYLTSKEESACIKASREFINAMEKEFIIDTTEMANFLIFGFHDHKIIADGKNGLAALCKDNSIANRALNRAFAEGGDLCGSLVVNQNRWLKNMPKDAIVLIPRKSKRYMFGILGGVGIALSFVLGAGLAIRGVPKIIRWVKHGFSSGRL